MELLSMFDTEANFWTMNPQLKIGFKKLYDSDKSKEKIDSSTIMWAIALLIHPDSKYAATSLLKRKTIIEESLLNTQDYDWSKHEEEIRLFKDLCLSRSERTLITWKKKLEQIELFIDKQEYNFNTRKDIEDALKSLDTLWKRYRACEAEVDKEKATGEAAGGSMESLSDLGQLF